MVLNGLKKITVFLIMCLEQEWDMEADMSQGFEGWRDFCP